ncbi:MAG: type II secretion system F family protein [Roseburia sp.]
MRILELILGTVLAVLYIIQSVRGKKYEELLEPLDGEDYPLKELYVAGYAWNEVKIFSLRGNMKEGLMGQARLLYDSRYAEYYANLVWAQVLTFGHLMLCLGFLLAGLADSMLFVVIGIAGAGVFGYYFAGKMKEQVANQQMDCMVELPEVVSTMALLINAGMTLREVWELIAYSKEGTIYELMQQACSDMQNGMAEIDAIYRFGTLSNAPEIKKFASSLTQGIEKGSSDLSIFLSNQSSEMWNLKRQIMLQKGEVAATKLLIPTVMIFGGILLIVIAAAVGMLL